MQVTQPPPPTRAVNPESGKQGGERWAESNNISTLKYPHLTFVCLSTHSVLLKFFGFVMVVVFKAEKTKRQLLHLVSDSEVQLIRYVFPPAQSPQL